jgi:hypothetical protein
MRYLLVVLLLSCTKPVLTVSIPDAPVEIQSKQPPFLIAMPFEAGSIVEDTKSIPVGVPVAVEAPARRVLCSERIVVLHDTTIVPTYIKSVHYDTVYVDRPIKRGILETATIVFACMCFVMWMGFVLQMLFNKINRERKR